MMARSRRLIPVFFTVTVFLGCVSSCTVLPEADGSIPITIGCLIGANTSGRGWSGDGVQAAMEMALEDVNNSELLPGYTLKLDCRDSQCNPGLAAASLVHLMQEEPPKLMVVGETCSPATVPTAQMAHFFNLVQLTPTADSPELADRDRFKTLYSMILGSHKTVYPLADICRHFGWKHVALVRHSIPYFYETANFLETHLQSRNISILAAEAVTEELPVSQVNNLKLKDVRIIIYVGYEKPFRALLCQAYRSGLYGPLYQWLSTAFYDQGWLDVQDTPCSPDQLKKVANLTLGSLHVLRDLSGQRGVSGRTYTEYEKLYIERTERCNMYHAYAYDAIWTVALTLHKSMGQVHSQKINETCSNGSVVSRSKTLADFTYKDEEMAMIFFTEMSKVKFLGVSGAVSFDRDGGRHAVPTQLGQIQLNKGDAFSPVGYHYADGRGLEFSQTPPLLWRGDGPPYDLIQLRLVKVYLEPAFLVVVTVLAVCGTLFALAFLAFNYVHRKEKLIKMSSPRLNNVIAVGCILAYITVVVHVLDGRWVSAQSMPYVMCTASMSLLMMAFTLSFGAMFAKTWRVYSIVREKTGISKMRIHDHHLLGFVGILLLVDMAFVLVWNTVDPPILVAYNGTKTESRQFAYIKQTDTCESHYYIYWCGAVLVWKGILLLAGCLLAFETRNVHIPALNDSRYIAVSVYNTIVMAVVGLAVNLAMRGQRHLTVSFTVGTVFFTATLALLLLFVPKIIELRRMSKLKLHLGTIRAGSTASILTLQRQLSSPVITFDNAWQSTETLHVCEVCQTRKRTSVDFSSVSESVTNGTGSGRVSNGTSGSSNI